MNDFHHHHSRAASRWLLQPLAYLLAFVWVVLGQGSLTGSVAPSGANRIDAGTALVQALAPTELSIAKLRHEALPQSTGPDEEDSALLPTVRVQIVPSLTSQPFHFLRANAPLASAQRPGAPRAPPLAVLL